MHPQTQFLMQKGYKIKEVGPWKIRIHPTLKQESRAANSLRLFSFSFQLLFIQNIALRVTRTPMEGAK